MNKTDYDLVCDFHDQFKLTKNNKPTILDNDTKNLRIALITEEYNEVMEAFEIFDPEKSEKSFKHLAKELADLIYVLQGTAISFGINMDKAFSAVHTSNMSKLDKNGNVIHNKNGKVMKSDQYKEADMGIIFEQ